MVLELFRFVETSTNGAAKLGEELLKLIKLNEQVTRIIFLPHTTGDRHQIVKVGVRFVCKPTMSRGQAERWFQHKTTGWLNGYVIYDMDDVESREVS